jgi:hypothetical protein
MLLAMGCGNGPETPVPPEVPELPRGPAVVEWRDGSIVGVRIYDTERELPQLFEAWRTLGINTVFASEELISSGGFRALARKNDTDLFAIFPVFRASDELAEDPGLWAITADGERAREEWVEFACPSDTGFRRRRVERARDIVRRLRPEGLSIDFIRHFVYWEKVGPDRDPATLPDTCYCVRCLQAFAIFLGGAPGSIPPQPKRGAAWIAANAADQWIRFKTETITSMAADIAEAVREIDPDVLINIHMVPWRRDDFGGALTRVAGQDPAALSGIADFLSPMTHSFMLHRPPEWIAEVVQDLDRASSCPVLPSLQVSSHYREGEVFSFSEFEAALRAALEPPSAGVILWSWHHVEADPEKAIVVRRVVRGDVRNSDSVDSTNQTAASQSAGRAATSVRPTPAR